MNKLKNWPPQTEDILQKITFSLSFVTQAVLSLKPVAPSCKLGLPSHHSHVSLFAKDGWNMEESHYTILLIFVYV